MTAKLVTRLILALVLTASGHAPAAADESAEALLARIDDTLFPENVTFDWEMTAKRADGTEKV